jgi:CO/xanthine dehydrogenase FAD-binding subunit
VRYFAPVTLEEAVTHVTAGAVPLAGGTDLCLSWEQRPHPEAVCDLGRVADLCGIGERDGRVWLGALTTHADLARSALVQRTAPLLCEAAMSIGAAQVRSRGTVGGNLANASPAADVATALLGLEATVEIVGPGGRRTLPVGDFLRGPRVTALATGELVTTVSFGTTPADIVELQGYEKLGLRAAQAIAVVSLAVRLQLRDGVVTHAIFALGSVAPTPIRAPTAEAALTNHPLDAEAVSAAASALRQAGSPIDDVRASAEYRRAMAGALLERFIERPAVSTHRRHARQ